MEYLLCVTNGPSDMNKLAKPTSSKGQINETIHNNNTFGTLVDSTNQLGDESTSKAYNQKSFKDLQLILTLLDTLMSWPIATKAR